MWQHSISALAKFVVLVHDQCDSRRCYDMLYASSQITLKVVQTTSLLHFLQTISEIHSLQNSVHKIWSFELDFNNNLEKKEDTQKLRRHLAS